MIKNLNDVYNMINQSVYKIEYQPAEPLVVRDIIYKLHHHKQPSHKMYICITKDTMNITAYAKNKIQYANSVKLTTARGEKTVNRFKDMLLAHNTVAMVNHINSL